MKGKYTIIFIPPDQSTTRQFQFSKLGKRYLGAGILLIGLIITGMFARTLYLSHYISHLQPTIDHITQLESTIEERDEKISNLNEKSTQITEDLKRIIDLEEKLSTILPLQPSSSSTSLSRGISPHAPNFILVNPLVQTPDQNAQIVADHLVLLQRYYEAAIVQKDQLEHTPSLLPVNGEITSPHGYRRNPFGGWSKEFHNGIDIACDYGTPVLATADGVVTFAGRNSIFGLRVDIDHGQGITTFYGHNSRLLVKEGDHVKKRDVIAYSGNSGRSTGSHLHYGTVVNERNVDPLTFTEVTKEI
ncbi:M23 family metallopeptidase [Desulfosporosinus nitroreducens]|uniref:M23 family metallopeptidase n=1 Tax=Desulfosporosinus nitroreducens TaxID=2018668 RepID=A0ABT8QXZ2_9FIRM|nr:M23 family metallopeptidase [Desulfosporosinus nitroreducens]MCO1601692.1 M23 family metallopeptidase [Desulfosporosinus nitroreducens]MDO0824761.1 M23 family metallopeptidase [Desulfosporosinus nitroreducens]